MLERQVIQIMKNSVHFISKLHMQKTHGNVHQSGQADLTGCYRGLRFEIEAKVDPNLPTVQQTGTLQKWASVGVFAAVVTMAENTRFDEHKGLWLFPVTANGEVWSKKFIALKTKEEPVEFGGIKLEFIGARKSRVNIQPLLELIESNHEKIR